MDWNRLAEVLDTAGIRHSSRANRNARISCVFAPWRHAGGSDRSRDLTIKIDPYGPSYYMCWSCGAQGTTRGMLTQLAQHQGPSDELTAAIALAKAYDTWDKLPSREEVEKREAEESAQIAADLAATRLRALEFWKAGVPQYAMTRDIMVETCRDWHLGFDREDGRWTFPFLDEQKRFVGLIGRDIWNRPRETCPKYRCYPGTEKSKYLYGGHLVGPLLRSGSCRTVLLVEGPLDVLRTVQNEFPAVVSSTGCKLSPTQRSLLLAWDPTCVILGYDEDKAGEAGTAGAAAMLRGRVLLKRLALPPKQDPGDLDKDAFAKALYGARLIG